MFGEFTICSLENGSEEDVIGVGTYQLLLQGGNKLLLFDALYAPGCEFSFCL